VLEEVSLPACEYEEQVVAALGAGNVSDQLAAHMDQCAVCRDVKLVFRFLETASVAQEQTAASAAGLIWWRARLYEKRALAARSVTPIRTVQTMAIVLVLAAAAIFAAVAGPDWIGKASPLVVSVVICGCGLIVSAAGLLTFWARAPK
jgi:preprotein translocase subunit Sec61beta